MGSEEAQFVAAPASMKRIPVFLTSILVPAGTGGNLTMFTRKPVALVGSQRCEKLNKQCIFFEIPKDPMTERLETVESEVRHLREQLDEMRDLLRTRPNIDQNIHPDTPVHNESRTIPPIPQMMSDVPGFPPRGVRPTPMETCPYDASQDEAPRPVKKRRSGFEIREEPVLDFITLGLMTAGHAAACFNTFFQGCDRYIPIFDPKYDSFDSVRNRSSILLNAICAIGGRIDTGFGSQLSDILHAELKKQINVVIQNEGLNCLESVQALLVAACYSAERSLLLSFAIRMGLALGMDQAFEELTHQLTVNDVEEATGVAAWKETEDMLMWKSRTWFGLQILEHIFSVDGGKPPGIRMTGNARRCRKLLRHPSSTTLDLRLFSQVELNVIRVHINGTLGPQRRLDRAEITHFVDDTKLELDLWFDLLRAENSLSADDEERPPLLAALRVQKCWSEMVLHCKALRSMGVENVAAMSDVERNILVLAKLSARNHLRLITIDSNLYLAKLKYAMDFVWAKCAFSFLLLLKLSRLLPEGREESEDLLDQGTRLLEELTNTTSGNGKIYLQILRVSIDKYQRTLHEDLVGSSAQEGGGEENSPPFWELFDAQTELHSFVPEQFVSEWEFPALNLFYFPVAWQDFFGDFSLAA